MDLGECIGGFDSSGVNRVQCLGRNQFLEPKNVFALIRYLVSSSDPRDEYHAMCDVIRMSVCPTGTGITWYIWDLKYQATCDL